MNPPTQPPHSQGVAPLAAGLPALGLALVLPPALVLVCAMVPVVWAQDGAGPDASVSAHNVAPQEVTPLDGTPLEIIPLDEVVRGQKGYGMSVFSGTQAERFEVEVLGVQKSFGTGTSSIIARLTGQGLEKSGVIAGMSGSPVFLDGRLAGAVAYSWTFTHEAIAGITPIETMRQVAASSPPGDGARRARGGSWTQAPVTLEELASARPPEDLLRRQLAGLGRLSGDGVTSGLLWSLGGFGERTQRLLGEALGSTGTVAAAGGMAAGGTLGHAEGVAEALLPGSPVAAVLVQGDLQLAATGTVTDRRGEQILAFGHPFLGFGPVSLPMASAEVVTVISRQASSFKISNLGPVIGAFEEDRKAALYGRLGAVAPTIPMTVRLAGEGFSGPLEYHMELADMPSVTPSLIAVSVLGALEAAGHATGAQGLDVTARLELEGHEDLVLEQSYDGDPAVNQAALYLLAFSATLTQTPLADVRIRSVEVDIRREPEVRTVSIVAAYPERTVVEPGETVGVHLEMMAHGGEPLRQRLEVTVPEEIGSGTYYVILADGATGDAARLAVEPAGPTSFRQLLDFLRSLHSMRELQVLGLVQARGLFEDGEVLPQLPGSVAALRGGSPSSAPLRLAIVSRETLRMERPLAGAVRVDFRVERP